MDEHKDVGLLLKNIQEGIRLYGVKELNEAITKALYEKTDKASDVEFILDEITKDFNISRNNLILSKRHGYTQKARQLAYCLLYFDIGLSLRAVATIFGKYVRSVAIAIENYRKLNPLVKEDRDFLEKYQEYQKKILLNINKEQK
jgi:chromosomal replication initiation ATPase DnaA